MIKTLNIKDFRSVEAQSVNLGLISFLYGNNAAGKSSLFYAFNVLRNIVSNPNQPIDNFFNLGFANLGTFKQVVFRHKEEKSIEISLEADVQNSHVEYGIKLNPKKSEFFLKISGLYSLLIKLPVTFPYALNQNTQETLVFDSITYNISWNGITAQVSPGVITDDSSERSQEIASIINKAAELVRSVDIVPLKRGFSKPQYGTVNVTQFPITEDEVASVLAVDDYIDAKVSTYLEQVVDRQFRAKPQSGTSLVSLTTIEKASKNTSDLVNDGFGVNQLVYVLAKVLNKNATTLFIEEPEINLHPGIVRKLPNMLIEIVNDERKQLILSTHSEALVIAMLSSIAKGIIQKEDVAFYLTSRPKGATIFEEQIITEEGQVEGGLSSFMAGELEDIESFIKARKHKKTKKVEELNSDLGSENLNEEK